MKIYFPLNLKPKCPTDLYGWLNNEDKEVFVASFERFSSKTISPELELIGQMSASQHEAGCYLLVFKSRQTFVKNLRPIKICPKGSGSKGTSSEMPSHIIIFYELHTDYARSSDYSGIFSSAPMKLVKQAAILQFNPQERFLKLNRTQMILSRWSKLAVEKVSIVHQSVSGAQWPSFSGQKIELPSLSLLLLAHDRCTAYQRMYAFLLLGSGWIADKACSEYRNDLILTVFDLLLGLLIGHVIQIYSHDFCLRINRCIAYITFDMFEDYLDWFMGWPAGFKLNAMLTRFLGSFFLTCVRHWKMLFLDRLQLTQAPLTSLLVLKHAGFGALVAFAGDYWAICTIHIRVLAFLIGRVYRVYFTCLLSLCMLFQQLRWNALKNRHDRIAVQMEQLLVGSAMFSILFCTLPTVMAYYGLFVGALLAVYLVSCIWHSVLKFLHMAPIYWFGLRLRRPHDPSLAAGIKLRPRRPDKAFFLELEPVTYSALCAPLLDEIGNIWKSRFNFELLKNIAIGKAQ